MSGFIVGKFFCITTKFQGYIAEISTDFGIHHPEKDFR